ncbi:hypothetical protein U0070_010265 [Myodes glareolus]|uniref:Uncharacterized protein n=1 Tax=Myodes glareolus TaxID=447135 RepID=A0AAW0HE72_MYOGA
MDREQNSCFKLRLRPQGSHFHKPQVTTPKLITDLVKENKTISFGGCMSQILCVHIFAGGKSGSPALWEVQVPPPSLQVQEGEHPNRLDPKNPVYAEETSPSVIVNGFSERLQASHIQKIRPHSENLVGSHARSVTVHLALIVG